MGEIFAGMDLYAAKNTASESKIKTTNPSAGTTSLDMTDFLSLMVKQFQNQDIENAASTSDMMNQMVQMSVMQAVTDITEATRLMYSAGLVGKEVTIGQFDDQNVLHEIVGTVTGTGTYQGESVIYVNDKGYRLNEIMAIGRLPAKEQEDVKTDPANPDTQSGDQV